MNRFPYELSECDRPKLGLIILQNDETLEDDLRRVFDVATAKVHVTRIASGTEVTPDTLHAMENALPTAASLFPNAAQFDVVGYGCTSGTKMIGAAQVAHLVKTACFSKAVTDPLTATLAAARALRIKRLGIVSPYIAEVAEPLSAAFESAGIRVPTTLSFGESCEENVARIAPESIKKAAEHIVLKSEIDGIFLSCTNLRTLEIIADLEHSLQIPVLSSNQTLTWHLARLAGITAKKPELGRIWTTELV